MPKQVLAIVTCRVSSIEQLESNSLNRQLESVKEAAEYLNAKIAGDGIWSGSVSSKSGSNYSRKDLNAMLDYCKKNPAVKYLIVDEIDRFMRSVDEMFYFEVLFREKVGVKVWYAGDPALNSDDPLTKLRRAMEAFKAEGSNLERQIKSIKGQTAALKEGRYPFAPKPGYKRGYERGIQEIHEVRGPILGSILARIADRLITPTQGLVELNKSKFVIGHSLYKMDKFRKIVTDPFYAGIVEITRQVNVRNENGLHNPLITKEQHNNLLQVMDEKKKTQSGPRKNGNPEFPLSNHVHCELCINKTNGRYVGYNHGNGRNPNLVYQKYRCRGCNRYLSLQELHPQVVKQFDDNPITDEGLKHLLKALNVVWKQQEGQAEQETYRIKHKIRSLNESINNQVEAITDPANAYVKEDILNAIKKKKAEVATLEGELTKLSELADADKEQFLRFAFDFVDNMGSNFLNISPDNRLKCKQLVFPAGFYLDKNNKVYTPEISSLYRLASNKKAPVNTSEALLVRVRGL
ncbi:MAG TPA: recombinase family protein [Patescibacteria group bacterium]|nr:recombinase family protein [Patescibacteria group bacterium]